MPGQKGMPGQIAHILSVDVEDYFQVSAFEGIVSRQSWDQLPPRVVDNTRRLLDLFDQHQARGTFFLVGWVADHFPHLVREIHARGHELACHSYWHRLVYSLTPEQFREDTRRALQAIQQAAGVPVYGYRAPSWSITARSLWALEILAEEGFRYDSSIFPIRHDRYGVPGASRLPYLHRFSNGSVLKEFPPATLRCFSQNLPAAGGGYLRIFPLAITRWAFHHFEHQLAQPLVLYVHPWEIDPDQPRMRCSLLSRFRHYTNLAKMEARLEYLLHRYRFQSFQHLMAAAS